MKFKNEDEAYEYYLEECQRECGFDITESDRLMNQLADEFNDWVTDENITWDE